MIKSMTGYGKQLVELSGRSVNIEIKSLNSRYLDLNLKMSSAFREKEIEIRNLLTPILVRGKTDFYVEVVTENGAGAAGVINQKLFKTYFDEINGLAEKHSLPRHEILGAILKIPGILEAEQAGFTSEEWEAIFIGIKEAVKTLDEFRNKEGLVLEDDMQNRITAIQAHSREVQRSESERKKNIRGRIENYFKELTTLKVDENRLEQEMIYYMEKLDVTEELVRLDSHCAYFLEIMESNASEAGKKLSFIGQEIGREINTIGSKANDAELQKIVVEMKDQLEKIKEQVNNIL